MKPFHVLLISLLTATPLTAILDTNQNTLSDLWEAAHNNQQLLDPQDPDHQPTADPDGDGWTNLEESVAGTDPFSSLYPGGMLRPDLANHPATYGDPINGIPQLITPEAISLTWPTVPGKAYQIQYSADLTPNSWSFLPETLVGSGQNFTITIPLTQNNGSPPDALFWRISITDLDSDGDTLTNAEEISLTTNPNHSDSDLDGIPDNLDSAPLASATQADPDGLGLANANLLAGLKANWSFEEATIPFANLFGKNEARCENHAPATTPSWPVLVPLNLSGSSAFQRRGFVSQGLPIADKSIFGDGKIFTGITNSFTISFWHRFQKDSIKNGSNIYKCLWSLSDCRPAQSSISSNTLAIRKKNATEEEVYLGAYTWTGSGGNPHSTIIGKSFTRPLGTADDGKWHHYTIVRSSGKFTLLIDGVTMPGLDDATVPWLDIPLNKATPTSPTDYTYDWNTFGRMAPNLAHNQTLGTFDRIRLWSRPLTSNETTLLYQEDIDNDGLWDVTEVETQLWRDLNSDGIYAEGETIYSNQPSQWQVYDTDTDGDNLTDVFEQTLGTKINDSDTDGDLLPDGWEYSYGISPLNDSGVNGISGDLDEDGADNFKEWQNNSDPTKMDSDDDGANDNIEITNGGNPNDSSDNGEAPEPSRVMPLKLSVGDPSSSESERYWLEVVDLETNQTIIRHAARDFGVVFSSTYQRFLKGNSYKFKIHHGGTSQDHLDDGNGPDFDYYSAVEFVNEPDSRNYLLLDPFDPKFKTKVYSPHARVFESAMNQDGSPAGIQNITDFKDTVAKWEAILGCIEILSPELDSSDEPTETPEKLVITHDLRISRWFEAFSPFPTPEFIESDLDRVVIRCPIHFSENSSELQFWFGQNIVTLKKNEGELENFISSDPFIIVNDEADNLFPSTDAQMTIRQSPGDQILVEPIGHDYIGSPYYLQIEPPVKRVPFKVILLIPSSEGQDPEAWLAEWSSWSSLVIEDINYAKNVYERCRIKLEPDFSMEQIPASHDYIFSDRLIDTNVTGLGSDVQEIIAHWSNENPQQPVIFYVPVMLDDENNSRHGASFYYPQGPELHMHGFVRCVAPLGANERAVSISVLAHELGHLLGFVSPYYLPEPHLQTHPSFTHYSGEFEKHLLMYEFSENFDHTIQGRKRTNRLQDRVFLSSPYA
jgi:hypothetical protein